MAIYFYISKFNLNSDRFESLKKDVDGKGIRKNAVIMILCGRTTRWVASTLNSIK